MLMKGLVTKKLQLLLVRLFIRKHGSCVNYNICLFDRQYNRLMEARVTPRGPAVMEKTGENGNEQMTSPQM